MLYVLPWERKLGHSGYAERRTNHGDLVGSVRAVSSVFGGHRWQAAISGVAIAEPSDRERAKATVDQHLRLELYVIDLPHDGVIE